MSSEAAACAVGVPAVKKGHPKGLYVLFFTEMWERFCYYGMRTILVYYMTKSLLFSQEKSSQIYGLYTGLTYFMALFGGILADRVIGQRKAVILGGALMAVGEFMLMSKSLFFPGLFFLILGVGALKPNISTQVGSLYAQGDHRRDRAFSIFYVGINVGAFISPLICGTIGELYGWNYGFGAAGLGMILGLIIYLCGQKYLAPDNTMKKKAAGEAAKKAGPMAHDDKSKIVALLVLCLFNIVFWAIYEQQGNTLALWMDANTNRHIFGWEMPATWFQSFNPIMIFAFTPLLTMFWARQAKRGKEPSSIAKMAIGCILGGLSFLVLIPAAGAYADHGSASVLWLVLNTAILTFGELYLSPIGLSLVTKIAPIRMVSMFMGLWFFAMFGGNYLCGFLGTFWEKMPKSDFFLMLALLSCGAGLGIFTVLKPLKKAIGHGHEETVDV
ncbi:MAG: peptide MFS transporter [Pseudomonadota bacterium]